MPDPIQPQPIAVFRHVPHETLGNLEPVLRRRDLLIHDVEVWREGVELPSVDDVRALIVMGGPMGVYEQFLFPFLTRELEFIGKMISANKPVLGICLGSQLIASALGSRVYPNGKKEIGWYPLEGTLDAREDFLFSDWPVRSTIFQWHGDTFDLPMGAVQLFSSPLCRNQAFRYGKNVYGLQFHPEVDAAMINEWLYHPDAERELKPFGVGKREQIEKDTFLHLDGLSQRASGVFDRFAQLCSDDALVTSGRF